jgi:hypothetical protein
MILSKKNEKKPRNREKPRLKIKPRISQKKNRDLGLKPRIPNTAIDRYFFQGEVHALKNLMFDPGPVNAWTSQLGIDHDSYLPMDL